MSEQKLTPEAEAHIKEFYSLYEAELIRDILRHDNKLLKAQGLFTREEVKEFIKAAVSIGGRNPGIETDAEKVADTLLPTPPKTEV